MAVHLVAAFALGVAIGGVGVAKLQDRRDERAQSATVALVAMAGGSNGGDRGNGTADLDAQLIVINAGHAPITARVVGAQESGVLVRDAGQPQLLDPGGTGVIDLRVTVECEIAEPDPLPMRFSVQTADQRTHEISYTVAVEGSAWHQRVDALCDPGPATTG
ncbi:hypothetical protein OG470_27520 [Micromonospora sp. NBC_00389]|uniref:hypothetical protein n=1 Tax=Micromonospora sp. NBC_00389 TaxID=2903586 RepID=UPI002E1E223E